MFDEFFRRANELRAAGVPFATAVVVRAERPTSARPGDRAIVTLDGSMFGWIGGSCAQPTVVKAAVRALEDGVPRLIRLSPDPGSEALPEGISEVPMTCFSGGTLDIFVEPHRPAPRLLVVGSLPVAQALVSVGKAIKYEVIAVDPTESDAMAHADRVIRDVAAIPEHVTPLTFVVVAAHGEYDERALVSILDTPAPYVGLVASRKRGQSILAALEKGGLDAEQIRRVRFPAGLDINAQGGDEIAVSIIAEIVQTRRAMGELSWQAEAEAPESDGEAGERAEPSTSVDPVCQMTVEVAGAMHTHDHAGQTFRFCCDGCRAQFAADPEAYLSSAGA